MEITRSSKIQSLMLAAALTIGFCFVSPVSAQFLPEGRSFILDINSKALTDLGTLGGDSTIAQGINDAGQVVGASRTAAGDWQAFITGPNGGGMTALGDYLYTSAINDAGHVVEQFLTAPDNYHAFITGPNGMGMTDLGTLGGVYINSSATAINDEGQMVGESITATGDRHAFITGPNGGGMTELGTLGGDTSSASDINDAGQVVGSSDTDSGDLHAFITGPNGRGMTDLNSLVDLPAGIVLTSAFDINNMGQIVVHASTIPLSPSLNPML